MADVRSVARGMSKEVLVARLTMVFTAIAVLLACVGLYGTVSYSINRRVPEFGLRMALGADRRSVLALVLREWLTVVVFGAALGIPLADPAARSVQAMLSGVSSIDPIAYGAGALVLVSVGVLAAVLPARRASRIDPMGALNRT